MKRTPLLVLLVLLAGCGEDPVPEPPAPHAVRDGWRLVYRIGAEADAEEVAGVVRDRLAKAGIEGTEVRVAQGDGIGILVAAEHGVGGLERVKSLVARPGTCEFRMVALPPGAVDGDPGPETTERARRAELGDAYPGPPEGTEWVPSRSPGEEDRLLEVPADPRHRFTGADLDPDELATRPSGYGTESVIAFALREDRRDDFGDFTAANVKRLVAIVIDGKVETAPVIRERLPGRGAISGGGIGGFSKEEAEDLVVALSGAPLPAELILVDEAELRDGVPVETPEPPAPPPTGPGVVAQLGTTPGWVKLAVSGDGRRVVTRDDYGSIVVYDGTTGRQVQRIRAGSQADLPMALSPDGEALAVSLGFSLAILDVATGEVLVEPDPPTSEEHGLERIGSVAFSPDGRLVVAACGRNGARLWDAATGRPQGYVESGGSTRVAVFSPDGTRVVTVESGQTRVWDLATREPLLTLPAPAASGGEGRPVFLPDGSGVLLGTVLRDFETGEVVREFPRTRFDGRNAAVSPDGRYLLRGGMAGSARLLDLETGEEARRFEAPDDGARSGWVDPVAFTGGGRHVVAGFTATGGAAMWETETGRLVRRFKGPPLTPPVALGVSPDGGRLLIGRGDGSARLWDLATGAATRVAATGTAVHTAAFSPDGGLLLLGCGDGRTFLVDPETEAAPRVLAGPEGVVRAVAFRPGSTQVVLGYAVHGAPDTAVLWVLGTGEEVRRFPGPRREIEIAVSPDGRRLWTADGNLYDLSTGAELEPAPPRGAPGWFGADGGFVRLDRIWKKAGARGSDLRDGIWTRSPDGSRVAVIKSGYATLLDVEKAETVSGVFVNTALVHRPLLLDRGRLLVGRPDGTIRIHDSEREEAIGRFVGFPDGSWAVLAADGRYDASRDAPGNTLVAVEDGEEVPFDRVPPESRVPGLLRILLAAD